MMTEGGFTQRVCERPWWSAPSLILGSQAKRQTSVKLKPTKTSPYDDQRYYLKIRSQLQLKRLLQSSLLCHLSPATLTAKVTQPAQGTQQFTCCYYLCTLTPYHLSVTQPPFQASPNPTTLSHPHPRPRPAALRTHEPKPLSPSSLNFRILSSTKQLRNSSVPCAISVTLKGRDVSATHLGSSLDRLAVLTRSLAECGMEVERNTRQREKMGASI